MVTCVRFRPDAHSLSLFSSSEDCTIVEYDLYTRSVAAIMKNHMSVVTSITFGGKGAGSHLISGTVEDLFSFLPSHFASLLRVQ